jgi:NADH-quinone oxidoreductase subunit L
MTYVLLILAFLSTFLPFSLNPLSYEVSWLWSGFRSVESTQAGFYHQLIPVIVNAISMLLIILAYLMYVNGKYSRLVSGEGLLFRVSSGEWYLNQFYSFTFVKSVEKLAELSWRIDRYVIDSIVLSTAAVVRNISDFSRWTDKNIVDGAVNGSGAMVSKAGSIFRMLQSGRLQHYLLSILLILLTFLILTFFI